MNKRLSIKNKASFGFFLYLTSTIVNAWTAPLQVNVTKYFDNGPVEEQYTILCGVNGRAINDQLGILTDSGFRGYTNPKRSGLLCATDPNDPTVSNTLREQPFMTVETLSKISGQMILELIAWESYQRNMPEVTAKLSRSAEVYTLLGFEYIIVNLKGKPVSPNKPKLDVYALTPLVPEATGQPGKFLIMMSTPQTKDTLVKFRLQGTAKNGKDYQKIASKAVIPAGDLSATIEVSPIDDVKKEKTETVKLKLVKTKTYQLGAAMAMMGITDND